MLETFQIKYLALHSRVYTNYIKIHAFYFQGYHNIAEKFKAKNTEHKNLILELKPKPWQQTRMRKLVSMGNNCYCFVCINKMK